jgi:hypothetical protein
MPVEIPFTSKGDLVFGSGTKAKRLPSLFRIKTLPSRLAVSKTLANCCRASLYVYNFIGFLSLEYFPVGQPRSFSDRELTAAKTIFSPTADNKHHRRRFHAGYIAPLHQLEILPSLGSGSSQKLSGPWIPTQNRFAFVSELQKRHCRFPMRDNRAPKGWHLLSPRPKWATRKRVRPRILTF